MTKAGVAMTPASDGATVDASPVIAAALAAVERPDAPAEVVVPVATTPVPAAVSDAVVRVAADEATRMIGDVRVAFGKKAWTIKSNIVRGWIGFATAADGSIHPTVDATKIPAALKAVTKAVLKPAKSAVFLRAKSGRTFGVAASADGRQLDVAATSQMIADALAARALTGAPVSVKVAIGPVTPKLTTAQAKLKAPVMTLLGTWTTWFPISDHNFFGANIWIPAQIINGTVLGVGQTFDWWNAVGDVSPSRGFGPGGVIKGNHTDPTGALGGGMCSSSTTLFNAALRAGLQMGARGNHRYYINRYPLGLDATVWKMGGAVQDMSFTNDTGHPILILGIKTRAGGRGFVTYQLWGVPDGRRVSLSAPSVTNVVQATTSIEYVSTLPHGVRNQTEYPSNQMDVSVSRVVRDKNGRVIHSEVWQSHYVLWNGIIQIGR
jgi:vancomycin resistance protein YoaR